MVTSFSTPRPAMMTPHITTERSCRSGAALASRKSSSLDTPVRWVQRVAHQPSAALVIRPKMVPTRAVVVRVEKPCAA